MNTISNNKLMFLTVIGTLLTNGCVAHNNLKESSFSQPKSVDKKSKTWKKINKDKSDCPDCYALGMGVKKSIELKSFEPKEEALVYDSSISPFDNSLESEEIKVTPKQSYVNSSMDSFNTKLTSDTTIQVGAFRHYSGAKKTAKKYSLLSSQYSVKIETGVKGGIPIHRVRISGFHSKGQAKAFMQRYASNDAFLVRR